MSSFNPAERQLIARQAAHQSWANTQNRTARTAPARDAFLARFEDQVDPGRELTPGERAKRATSARKAHFIRLALRSAQARRGAAARREALDELSEAAGLIAFASDCDEGAPGLSNTLTVAEDLSTTLVAGESRGAVQ
jgi:hypothetical protein